jgi:Asp-tRNA(Asn)/Glu-tRNA(Gln) amidotransferase A subunit family amidase
LSEFSTGDPIFCTIWTLAGLPTITLPILQGKNKMPVGVQLIGALNEDNSLLKTANWLKQFLANEANFKRKIR